MPLLLIPVLVVLAVIALMHTWRAGDEGTSWFGAAGVAGSMAAGAVVLGYYLAYWAGVRRRLRRQIPAPARRR